MTRTAFGSFDEPAESVTAASVKAAYAGRPSRLWVNRVLGFLALLAFAALVAVRIPDILVKGRFWAEELAVYFAAARSVPWYDAIGTVHTGYLNVAASLAGVAASLVPLDRAPWVSTCIAWAIQLLPPLLLLTGGVAWLRRRWAMAVALLLMLTAPSSAEVWMNSITSQFHLGLAVAIILAVPTRGGWIGALRGFVLVLAPLSGPAGCFFVPLFFLRAMLDLSRPRMVQAALIAAAAAVQFAVVVLHPEPARSLWLGPRLLAYAVFVKQVLLPTLGWDMTRVMGEHLYGRAVAGEILWVPILIDGAIAVLVGWGSIACRDATIRWLLAGAIVSLLLSYFGALGNHYELIGAMFGARYAFIPSSLFALALFGLALTRTGSVVRPVAGLATGWLLAAGIGFYLDVDPYFTQGPAWRDELAHYRADKTGQTSIQGWPDVATWNRPFIPQEH